MMMSDMASYSQGEGPPVPVSDPLTWEQEKWRAEYDLKRRELELREREQNRSTWSNPLVVAILAAAVAGLSSAVVTVINGKLQRDIEDSRSEASRILEMIKTGEPDKAAANLQFLLDTGLISKKDRVEQIRTYLVHRQPGTGPVLPAADGRYRFEQSEGLTQLVATTLQKSLNDYIAYLDRLGLRRDAEQVSIRITRSAKGEPAGYPYYNSGTIVIDQAIADDVDMPRHEYTHHVLMAGHERMSSPAFSALEMGISWYLPCSFSGHPVFGTVAAQAMKVPRAEIGDFSQPMQFAPPTKRDDYSYTYQGGAMWGTLFWEIRGRIGQQGADAIIVQAWNDIEPLDNDAPITQRFSRSLVKAAASISSDAQNAVSELLKKRGYPS